MKSNHQDLYSRSFRICLFYSVKSLGLLAKTIFLSSYLHQSSLSTLLDKKIKSVQFYNNENYILWNLNEFVGSKNPFLIAFN